MFSSFSLKHLIKKKCKLKWVHAVEAWEAVSWCNRNFELIGHRSLSRIIQSLGEMSKTNSFFSASRKYNFRPLSLFLLLVKVRWYGQKIYATFRLTLLEISVARTTRCEQFVPQQYIFVSTCGVCYAKSNYIKGSFIFCKKLTATKSFLDKLRARVVKQ